MLEPKIRDLAQGKNFAIITFHLPSGDAASHVMWVDADDDHLLMNTEVHRAKFKAIQADPRVTVAVLDREDPYHYGEVRGRVARTETGPEARAMITTVRFGASERSCASLQSASGSTGSTRAGPRSGQRRTPSPRCRRLSDVHADGLAQRIGDAAGREQDRDLSGCRA